MVPSSENFSQQDAYALVLNNTQRITFASFLAFLFGSFLNAYVMSKMKILQHGRHFSIRAVASTLVGESGDSIVFFLIAFGGVIPLHDLLLLIVTQTTMKTFYEILVLPLTNVIVKWIKKKENLDTFDYQISYNPLKIKEI